MAKEGKLFRKAIAAIIILVVLIPCSVLIYDMISGAGEEEVSFYYMSSDGSIKPIDKNINEENMQDTMMTVLHTLQQPPKADGMAATVPKDLEFLSVGLVNDIAILNLSKEYFSMKETDEVVCRSSIVWTLTSLDKIQGVEIKVEGKPLCTHEGKEIGIMNRNNILIDGEEISAETTEYAILTLYFANTEQTDLAAEERVVEVNSNQTREKTILEQLIAGPVEKDRLRTIPAETKIRDVTTTKDGTCYVNLSEDFVTKHNGGKRTELLAIYSIVNSLCELEQIEQVQFLIEGKKLDEWEGGFELKSPFTAVNSLKTAEEE